MLRSGAVGTLSLIISIRDPVTYTFTTPVVALQEETRKKKEAQPLRGQEETFFATPSRGSSRLPESWLFTTSSRPTIRPESPNRADRGTDPPLGALASGRDRFVGATAWSESI